MKNRISLLLLILMGTMSSFTALHKFYVSVTNVEYSEKDQALQVISRVFIDDLEAVLLERYDVQARLGTPEESGLAKAYVERYFRTKFGFAVNGEARDFTFVGYRFDKDLIVCYLEVPGVAPENLKTVEVRNDVLTDLFEEQKNLVHMKVQGKRKSFVLIRENNKGMLNL